MLHTVVYNLLNAESKTYSFYPAFELGFCFCGGVAGPVVLLEGAKRTRLGSPFGVFLFAFGPDTGGSILIGGDFDFAF